MQAWVNTDLTLFDDLADFFFNKTLNQVEIRLQIQHAGQNIEKRKLQELIELLRDLFGRERVNQQIVL